MGPHWPLVQPSQPILHISAGFLVFQGPPGSILEGLGDVRGRFRRPPGLIFRGFFLCRNDIARTTSILEKPLKTSTGTIKFKVRTLTPYAKISRKNAKNRARSLSRKPCHKKLYKKLVPGSPARFSGVLDASRASLRHLLGTLGCLLAALGYLWGASWALLGTFWPVLGVSWAHVGSQGRPEARI